MTGDWGYAKGSFEPDGFELLADRLSLEMVLGETGEISPCEAMQPMFTRNRVREAQGPDKGYRFIV